MAAKRARRTTGAVRRLPSGRWQGSIRDKASGKLVSLGTFATKGEADAAVTDALAAMRRGGFVSPDRSDVTLERYATTWVEHHQPPLAPRTESLYQLLLRVHIIPVLGDARIGSITPETIRRWHASVGTRTGAPQQARAYRLLRAILQSAADDELLLRNPCRVKRAGDDRTPARPIATIPQTFALAAATPERWRAMVLLATFASLRAGEVFGLQRKDVDLLHGRVRVARQLQLLDDGTIHLRLPKADRMRTVAIPGQVVEELTRHLATHVRPGRDAWIFSRPDGSPLDNNYWNKRWRKVRAAVARQDATLPDGLRFHDLRHLGATLAAATGASTAELMKRLGHSTSRAAMIYQHATEDRDQTIATALGLLMAESAPAPVLPIEARRNQ